MTTEELLQWKTKLTEQMMALGPYGSMTAGAKSWTKDTSRSGVQSQLEAVVFVLNERSMGGYEGTMITDFSKVDDGTQGQPAGTNDQLSY